MYRFRKLRWIMSGLLKQFGLARLVFWGSLPIIALTLLLPPWLRVRCQRKDLLYSSGLVKDLEKTFAGYDFLFALPKWEAPEPPMGSTPGELFEATEYRIFWTMLIVEWGVIVLAACTLFVVLSRRLRVAAGPTANVAEQPAAPERLHDGIQD